MTIMRFKGYNKNFDSGTLQRNFFTKRKSYMRRQIIQIISLIFTINVHSKQIFSHCAYNHIYVYIFTRMGHTKKKTIERKTKILTCCPHVFPQVIFCRLVSKNVYSYRVNIRFAAHVCWVTWPTADPFFSHFFYFRSLQSHDNGTKKLDSLFQLTSNLLA